MKVRVVFTIDIDPKAWDSVYDTTDAPERVRQDVKEYIPTLVHELLADQGVLTIGPQAAGQ